MSGEIAVQPQNQVQSIADAEASDFYTSLRMDTVEEKMKVLQAVNNSTPLQSKVGDTINVKDVVLQTAQFVDPDTGLVTDTVRTTLIDEDGNAFHAASKGIAISLRTAFKLLGTPDTWQEPVPVTVGEGRTGRNRWLTLKF